MGYTDAEAPVIVTSKGEDGRTLYVTTEKGCGCSKCFGTGII